MSSGIFAGLLNSKRRAWAVKLLFLHQYTLGMLVEQFEMQHFKREQSRRLHVLNICLLFPGLVKQKVSEEVREACSLWEMKQKELDSCKWCKKNTVKSHDISKS